MIVHRRFMCIHGCPRVMYIDPGRNFVGPAAEFTLLRKKCAEFGMDWYFHPPVAHHANGAVEVMVKLAKKALLQSVGEAVLSLTELQTVCFEAAELVNERPLAITLSRGAEDMELNYLCPNQLILGRATTLSLSLSLHSGPPSEDIRGESGLGQDPRPPQEGEHAAHAVL